MRPALLLALLVGLAVPSGAQSQYDTYTGWAVSTDPVLPAAEAHPQLWFGADDLDALRAKWDDPAYAEVRARVQADVNRYRSRNPEATDPGDRAQMAKALAFAWIVDGDIVARVKGYQALLLAYQNVPREATSAAFGGEYDEIYRATWLQNFCAAYDWLHSELTADDEATVRAALAEEAALLAENMVSGVRYAPRPHNHRSKPAYAVGTAALTLSDHPDAADWLRLSLEQVNTTTRYQFSADGVYREGSHYWLYTFVNGLPFLWQYRQAGVDLFPAYQPTFEWAVRTRTGRGWMPALEDGFPKPAPTHMAAAAYADAPTDLHATAPLGQVLQWNWDTTTFFTSNYTGATNDVVWSVDEFLTMDLSIPATAPDASPTQRLESGQVAFRSDWNGGDPDTRMLLFHGVASADNHDHPDLLSYALDAENTPLAVDPGYGPDGFSDDRRDWYLSARAHNVLTVNGFSARDLSMQQNEGPEQTAFVDGPAFDAAEMRAPNNGVMGGAVVTRGVAFLDDELFVVYDHVEASNEASLQVHLHGRGAPDRTANRVTWTAPDDAVGDGGALHAAFFADGPLLFDEDDGWTSFYFDREETQRWVAARRNAAGGTFLHTLAASPVGAAAPATADHTDGALVSAELATDAGAWHLATQREPGTRTADRLATDAAFAAVGREGDAVTRWGVVRGAEIRWDGSALVEADAPLTLSADLRDPSAPSLTVAPSDGGATVTLQLVPATATPTGATLDGAALAYENLGAGRVRFVVPAAGGVVGIETDVAVSGEAAPGGVRLRLGAAPNPSAGAVRLALDLPVAGAVRVAVYDALGRRVATLADGPRPAGPLALTWAATVPAGVYLAVAETERSRATARLVRL
ncbi:heparinase II/III family protein [Rubrivirga sp. IMCC45206]|uniref:heparinase II/III domain-containing protein n=1 Tax=Rubrivirga sp. IMCC45206 TaxID=3391614 RepID=UPI0039902CEE